MTMTIKQYLATIRRCKWCPPDLEWQANVWPYPQADHSHLAIWRGIWTERKGEIPSCAIRIPLVGADHPGSLVRVAPGAPRPKEVVEMLTN